MSDFKRRPHLAGNTASSVTGQPHIVGYVQKDPNGEFPGIASLPAELRLETEVSGIISVSFTTDKLMSTIVDDINAGMAGFAEAEDRDGVLLIRTLGSGEGALIRVHPAILGYAAEDTTFTFGFPRHPDPKATVRAADQMQSPTRPDLQANPAGTGMLAFGEDRVASAYNRILQILSQNADFLFTQLQRPIAVPEVIRVLDDGFWAPRLHLNADGELDQIDVSGLGLLDSRYDGRRIFVGNLSNSSSLEDIAEYFAVMDSDDKEMLNEDTKVQVGVVSRGLRPGFPPSFPDEVSPPTSPLFNTSGVAPDGGNALGVDRVKSVEVITDIFFRSSIRCETATFITDGVATGDKATITLADVDVPFNHNGEYYVDVVVSEEELILRPINATDRGELNPDLLGVLGTVTVTSAGEFERGLFLTLVPPLPRFPPESGHLKIVLGMESTVGSLLVDSELIPVIRSSEEVDAYTQREIQRRITLDGVYDGPLGDKGAGHYARVDRHPFTLAHGAPALPTAGTSIKAGTGTLTGNILQVDSPEILVAADSGRVVKLSNGTTFDEEPFVIVTVLDGSKALLSPLGPSRDPLFDLVSGSTDWEIFDDAVYDIPAAFRVVSGPGTANSWVGSVFERRHEDSGTDGPVYGQSVLHLERLKLDRTGANISTFVVTFSGTNEVLLPFDPEDSYNIYAEQNTDTKGSRSRVGSLLRIHNGPYAGMYRVQNTRSSGVSAADAVDVRNLDGTFPTFAISALTTQASFYNVHMGTKVPYFGELDGGGPGYAVAGFHLFHDTEESNDIGSSPVLRVDWRGDGVGIHMDLNDENFVAYDAGDGASGSAVRIEARVPASGITVIGTAAATGPTSRREVHCYDARAFSNAADLSLEGEAYFGFTGFAGRFIQRGKDPAVVITRVTGLTPIAPTMSEHSVPAAMVLGSATGNVGRGSALEVLGSVYQRREKTAVTQWDDGGIFTETAIGAGRWLYPLQSRVSEPYYGTVSPTSDFGEGTRLGYPGQILPATVSGAPLSGTLLAKDHAVANMPHTALLDAVLFSVDTEALSRYVGTRISIQTGTFIGAEFYIVGFASGKAVLVRDFGAPITTEAVDFLVLGQRWHEAFLNIGDYALIGTALEFDQSRLTALTVGLESTDADFYSGGDTISPYFTSLETTTEHAISRVQAFPEAHGEGVAPAGDLASFPGMAATTIGSYFNQWQTQIGEPRSPFPNKSILHATTNYVQQPPVLIPGIHGAYLSATDPGDLITDGFALEHVTQESPNGQFLGWSPNLGGSLLLRGHSINDSGVALRTDTVRVWMRGYRGFPEPNYALRAHLWLATPQTSLDFTLKLMLDDGTEVASSGILNISTVFGQITEFAHIFEDSSLNDAAIDIFRTLSDYDQGIHLVMELAATNGFGASQATSLYIAKWALENISRPARITGPMEVGGMIRSQGYRYVSPIQGFQTVMPLEVDLLNRQEYARHRPHDFEDPIAPGLTNQVVEGDSVGLLKVGTSWYRPTFDSGLFFRKGIHNAAIVFYHPYFDPLWYANETAGNPAEYVKPGRTGFMGALNPPHGSQLSSLVMNLSFSPSVLSQSPFNNNDYAAMWQVWQQSPKAVTDVFPGSWFDKASWDGEAGVLIRLWRYNTLDFDTPKSPDGVSYLGTTPLFGFAELLHTESVDLSSTPPDFTLNGSRGEEISVTTSIDLREALSKDERYVDRRHYGYCFTVEFYGGARSGFGTATTPTYLSPGTSDATDNWMPTSPGGMAATAMRAYKIYHPSNTPPDDIVSDPEDGMGIPQVVKFRGARLGWVTDRGGHGGW